MEGKKFIINKKTKNFIIFICIFIVLFFLYLCFLKPYIMKKELISEIKNNDSIYMKEKVQDYYDKYGFDEEISQIYISKIDKDIANLTSDINNYTPPEINIKDISYSGKKVTFSITNNSENIVGYLKFDIRIMDNQNKVIDTDWTNWSGTLRPNDSAKIDAYVSEGKKIGIELSDWSFK